MGDIPVAMLYKAGAEAVDLVIIDRYTARSKFGRRAAHAYDAGR